MARAACPRGSNPISEGRHDPGRPAHERAYRPRKVGSTGGAGIGAMRGLIRAHLMHDGATAQVTGRQSAEMLIEMPFDLPLRLDHEPETGPIAREGGERPDKEGAGVPERIEQAGAGFELSQAALAPG